MTKNDNQNTGAKLVTIPLRVNPETIEENGQVGQIRYVKIGAKRYPCIMAKVPKEFAHQYMQIEWAEVKAEERSERCLVEDGRGGYIMCPESNKCACCEKFGHYDFDNFRPASLDAMYAETEYEPVSDQMELFDGTTEVMEMLVQRLAEIKPKFGEIFRELYRGNNRPLHIAETLGLGKSQTYDDVDRVRELAEKLYRELMDD